MIITGFAGDKLDLTINISSPDLRKIAIFAGLKQILKGDLDFYISVRGTKENPVFGVYGLVHNFQFNDVKFDSLFILADYKDEFITLHSLKMQKDTISSVITAKVPFGLKKGIIKDREIYANANINFSDIRFLSSYIKEVNLYKGEFKMNVEAKGDMNNLNIDGNIGLSNISFSIPKINLKMEGFSGNIKLNEKKVELEIVNGEKTIKTKGYVLLKDLKPYDMNINTELVNFYIKDVFYTEANLKGLLSLQGSPFSPSLKGNIDIMKVVANIPFGGRKKGVKPREFPMDIDITINMPRNVWIRNDLVDMELGGMVKVKKKDRIKIEGEMNVLAGYFYYFDKPFNVEEGKFLFVEEIIPNINLKARSTLSYEEETEDKKKNIITGPVVLEVSGTLQDLQFDLYTEPPLPPLGLQEIIPLLNLDMKWSDLAKFQRMSTTIPSKAVSYVIRTQLLNRIRNSLGIDALDLNANLFGAEKTTQITVGKYFTKNIYGSYTRDIFATNPDQFLLKYIMRRGNIILQRNEEGNIWGGFEVNIKR
jgi:autotransporter translocation and assembly factor TamB